MKKILIINGHPDKESLGFALAEAYMEGAGATDSQCKLINLIDLDFNPILKYGYRKRTELEPDLLAAQQDILAADHLVFIYPTWWGTFPALLKGFIDRVFLPKFSFQYRENSVLWDKLLKGRSARLITTMDAPTWYYGLIYRSPGHNAMKRAILNFCGVRPVKITTFGPVKTSNEKKRGKWIQKVKQLGKLNK